MRVKVLFVIYGLDGTQEMLHLCETSCLEQGRLRFAVVSWSMGIYCHSEKIGEMEGGSNANLGRYISLKGCLCTVFIDGFIRLYECSGTLHSVDHSL